MRKTIFQVFVLFVLISLFFFFPVIKNNIPFPGDLLIGEYTPYSSYSYFGFNPGSYPNKGQDFDVIRLIYPGKEFSIEQFKKGNIPLWNPYNFSGNPHIASLQSGTFYPLNLIFLILPMITAWTVYIMLQPILSAFFTYLLLKEYKFSTQSSIFGGIVFAFSSFMTVWMEYGNLGHSILWLPLLLYLLHKNLTKLSFIRSALLSIVLSMSLLSGYIQTSMYVFIFSFAYVLYFIFFVNRKNIFKNILVLFAIFIAPIFISAIQLFPMIELFNSSTRTSYSSQSFMNLLIPYYHIITLFFPDFFGNPATRNYWLQGTYIERVSFVGVMPIFFAIYAFSKKPSKIVIFYFLSVIIISLLVFDTFFSRFLYSNFMLPIISTGVPTRMMFLFCFSLSVLAAAGLNEFQSKINLRKVLGITAGFFFLFSLFWAGVFLFPKTGELAVNLSIAKRNLVLPSVFLIAGFFILSLSFIFKKYKRVFLYGIVILTIFDLFYFFHKITPFAPVKTLYPETEVLSKLKELQGIDRSWGYGSGYVETNLQTHEKLFGTDGYDALHLKWYGEFITASKNGKILYPAPRSEAVLEQGYGTSNLRENFYRQNILNLLGVKYILNKTNDINGVVDTLTFPEDIYKLVWQKGVWQIYQNKKALPRFFLTSKYIVETDKDKIISKLVSDSSSKTIILDEKPNTVGVLKEDPDARIVLNSYTPNTVSFSSNSKEDLFLFLSDTFDEGWKASIDSNYAKIYKANYAFRAVLIPKGKHEVVFSYYPKSFDLGLKITVLTIIIGMLIILVLRFKKFNE